MGDQVFDDGRVPAARFDPGPGSALRGSLGFPCISPADASAALEMVEAADRLISWASAMKFRATARLAESIAEDAGPRSEGQPERFGGEEALVMAVAEIATATAISEAAAARLVYEAAELCGPHRGTLDALECGRISEAHARVILDAARSVPEEDAPHFARAALERACTRGGRLRTPGQLRTFLRRMRERVHPETIETRKKAALRERGVWFAPEPDGMCTLTARLTAEAGLAIFNGLDHAARGAQHPTEARSLDALRADALAQRLLGHDPCPQVPAQGSGESVSGHDSGAPTPAFRPEIIVTIPVHTLLGIEPTAITGAAASSGAELEGYGPIDAPTARYLASLAPNWFRLFTDAVTGAALGVGRTAYRPPQALRRFLAYRDGTCLFPTCTCPAKACEPDHTTEWQHGGSTDPDNLALLCPRHHALKSLGAWTYTQQPESEGQAPAGGLLEWRSPLGRTYRTEVANRAIPESPPLPPTPPPVPPSKPPINALGAEGPIAQPQDKLPRREEPPPF